MDKTQEIGTTVMIPRQEVKQTFEMPKLLMSASGLVKKHRETSAYGDFQVSRA